MLAAPVAGAISSFFLFRVMVAGVGLGVVAGVGLGVFGDGGVVGWGVGLGLRKLLATDRARVTGPAIVADD
jgi:hypothetical protein